MAHHAEHAATVSDQLAVHYLGTGMEHLGTVLFGVFDTRDDLALFVRARITRACKHHDCGAALRSLRGTEFREFALFGSVEQREHIAIVEREHNLTFGVTEAAVVFHDLRALRSHHDAHVEHARVRLAFGGHALEGRFDNRLFHLVEESVRHHRSRAVGAHATRVRALVVIEDALVVLCRRENHVVLAVANHEDGGFFAIHEFFDHDRLAGFTEDRLVAEHFFHGVVRFLVGHADDGALARSEARRLHHDRSRVFGEELLRGGEIGEGLEGCRRHVILLHDILAEGLGAFERGSSRSRAESAEPTTAEFIHHASDQRNFGADNREVNLFGYGEVGDCLRVSHVDRHALAEVCHARVARSAHESIAQRRLLDCKSDGMFATTATNDENIHKISFFLFKENLAKNMREGPWPNTTCMLFHTKHTIQGKLISVPPTFFYPFDHLNSKPDNGHLQ